MKNFLPRAFLLSLWVGWVILRSVAFADDASDTMAAALEEQQTTILSEVAGSAPDVALAADSPAASEDSKQGASVAPVAAPAAAPSPVQEEVVKARDVLPETPQATDESSDEENLDEDEKGDVASSKQAQYDAAASAGELVMADFNSGDKPNNLGGDFGGWDKDPNDDTQTCRMSFASDDYSGDMEGFALRLDYDVDSPSPAYNGFWMKLENVNAVPYDTLSFYVRGASHRFTKRVKVEFKTPDNRSSAFYVSGITEQWQKIQIPFKRFKGIKNWSALGELIIVFDDVNTAPKKGTLLFDQITLERVEKGMAGSGAATTGYYLSEDKEPESLLVQPAVS